MTSTHIAKFDLVIQKTDVGAQKIDSSTLEIYKIVIASFLVQNRLGKIWFFEKSFLWTDTNIELVLGMSFLTVSDIDIWFAEKELIWRSYITTAVLSTTETVEFIDKGDFATTTSDKNFETIMMYIAVLEVSSEIIRMTIHSF